jgi:hypothetical protein
MHQRNNYQCLPANTFWKSFLIQNVLIKFVNFFQRLILSVAMFMWHGSNFEGNVCLRRKFSLQIYEPTDIRGYIQFIANIQHMKNLFIRKQLPERGNGNEILLWRRTPPWWIAIEGRLYRKREKWIQNKMWSLPYSLRSQCCQYFAWCSEEHVCWSCKSRKFLSKATQRKFTDFSILCKEVSSESTALLLYTEAQRLSCGEILSRAFGLGD